MKQRDIKQMITGRWAVDGAGVHLVRVLGPQTVEAFDPFLMLDSFDSKNPADYIKGFPMHPHRGIETITYLAEGHIAHEDSLGNRGDIHSGDSQWMTAGSGILHQEMPKAVPRMLGVQLWLNLPSGEKMTDPHYFDIPHRSVPVVREDTATVRVIAGRYGDSRGATPPHIRATVYDVSVHQGGAFAMETNPEETVFIFLLEGDADVNGKKVAEKTAVLFDEGEAFTVQAHANGCRFLFCSGKPLHEPVAWGGPIVMNTRAELEQAFQELEEGRFVKHNAAGR